MCSPFGLHKYIHDRIFRESQGEFILQSLNHVRRLQDGSQSTPKDFIPYSLISPMSLKGHYQYLTSWPITVAAVCSQPLRTDNLNISTTCRTLKNVAIEHTGDLVF